MKEYWRDPGKSSDRYCAAVVLLLIALLAATAKAITQDGWFKSGDLGVVDKEGFLYIRDRSKPCVLCADYSSYSCAQSRTSLFVEAKTSSGRITCYPITRLTLPW